MTREELIEGIISRLLGRKKAKYTPTDSHNPKGKWPEVKSYDTPYESYKVGDIVEVELTDGTRVHGKVTKKTKVKHGVSGIYFDVQKTGKTWPEEYKKVAHRQKWAYADQVVRVIK